MAVYARVKWLERAARESGAHHPPRREHGPPPALACMGGGGGRCVGAVDAMACMTLAMVIFQLYDAVAGSRGPVLLRARTAEAHEEGMSRSRPSQGPTAMGVACTRRAMSAGGGG